MGPARGRGPGCRRAPGQPVLTVPDQALGAILGFFAGFFLYVGAAELLPEAHRRDSSRVVVAATLGGALAIYVFSVAVGAIGVRRPLSFG